MKDYFRFYKVNQLFNGFCVLAVKSQFIITDLTCNSHMQVNLKRVCPFWQDGSRCSMRYCQVESCNEVSIT